MTRTPSLPRAHLRSCQAAIRAVCAALLLLSAACDGNQTVDGPDVQAQDAASPPLDTAGGGESKDIGAAPDALSLACPGGSGCACKSNPDCDNALCIDTPQGKRCATTCVENCEAGYVCSLVASGGDNVNICAPRFLRLCDPCSHSSDCQGLGAAKAACARFGARGNFCATACDTSADCPSDYKCDQVATVEGTQTWQCVPTQDGSGDPGLCACSALATLKGLGTQCKLKLDGGLACQGERHCGPNGLTDCVAPDPETESCDGVDNDCDGQTDEAACDDDNACTQDHCDGNTLSCSHTPSSQGAPCDDNSVCTEADTCNNGGCTGKPLDCSDGNPCTQDTCDPTKACQHQAVNGVPCSDGNLCTLGDLCADGACQPGDAKPCTSNQFCVTAQCMQATGDCDFNPKANGLACNDGSVCTVQDACQAGVCVGAAVPCDDDNPCTQDTCDAGKGCLHALQEGPCEDGNKCTMGDTCKAGTCKAGTPKDCDDGNACTADTCAATSGCSAQPTTASCDDGDPCSLDDVCKSGACVAGKAADCDDGSVCSADLCDPKTGKCQHPTAPADGKTCPGSGNKCALSYTCASGQCVAQKLKDCSDGDACTADACQASDGQCTHKALPDQAICAPDSWCMQGKCVSAPHCGDGKVNGETEECDDGNNKDGDGCSAGCKKQGPTPAQKFILGGSFTMGCDPKQWPSCLNNADENPAHEVTLSGYYVDRYEVTVDAYKACVTAGKCSAPKYGHAQYVTANWGAPDRGKHPINYLTWFQARDYCEWAGASRLCTEAEWEYAARGPDEKMYPWGAKEPTCKLAWFTGCGVGTIASGTLLDGQSPFGLYDMAGNVWEFVADVYDKGYYAVSEKVDPKGPSSGNDPNSANRVLRGGCFDCKTDSLRTSTRKMVQAPFLGAEAGVRCCRTP